jgi:hypothetical protein
MIEDTEALIHLSVYECGISHIYIYMIEDTAALIHLSVYESGISHIYLWKKPE